MGLTATAALWFLPAVVPVAFHVAFSDLQRMQIPNGAILALVAVWGVLGALVLPLPVFLWQSLHLPVMLVLGFALATARLIGAGDAKFMAAAAPFVAPGDLRLVIVLFAACLLAALITHRLVRASPLRRLCPDWQSWTSGRQFPMGFPLAVTLVLYLAGLAVAR